MAQNRIVLAAADYPENLGEQRFWNCNLQGYRQRLQRESGRLFGNQSAAKVDVLQLVTGQPEFAERHVRVDDELIQLLDDYQNTQASPRCQHFFIRAKSSQTRLNITSSMLKVLFSSFDVTPSFLDFLFTFGQQDNKKNFHFSGFRAKELWADLPITVTAGSSATWPSQFQLCYNLRSVEATKNPPEWPWSIRPTAIFHTFDIQTGDTAWINIKGSADIAPRIKRLVRSSAPSDPALINSSAASFKAALTTHLAYCEWSGENWPVYVGFLEDQLQFKTRYAQLATVEDPKRLETVMVLPERTATAPVNSTPPPRSLSWAQARRADFTRMRNLVSRRQDTTAVTQPQGVELLNRTQAINEHPDDEDFSYDDLRKLQHIEDQANVTLLVIRSNVNILEDIKGYYHNLHASVEFQATLGNDCDTALNRFTTRLSAIINDLKLQQSRMETLLQLLANRKSLLLQLFAHRNMSATKYLTERAQVSADKSQISAEKMESLTEHMKSIALKTEKETVFMRIITVVTLFFLPGTFVATLMSTDIVHFQSNGDIIHQFSWLALVVYLAITLPIMAVTFWVAVRYRRKVDRQTAKERAEVNAENEQPLLGVV